MLPYSASVVSERCKYAPRWDLASHLGDCARSS